MKKPTGNAGIADIFMKVTVRLKFVLLVLIQRDILKSLQRDTDRNREYLGHQLQIGALIYTIVSEYSWITGKYGKYMADMLKYN